MFENNDDDDFLDVHALTVGREIHHTKEPETRVNDDDQEPEATRNVPLDVDLTNSSTVDMEEICYNGKGSCCEDVHEQQPISYSKKEEQESHRNKRDVTAGTSSNADLVVSNLGTTGKNAMPDPEAATTQTFAPLPTDHSLVDEPYLYDKDMEMWGLSRRKMILAFLILIILIVIALSVTICGVAHVCRQSL